MPPKTASSVGIIERPQSSHQRQQTAMQAASRVQNYVTVKKPKILDQNAGGGIMDDQFYMGGFKSMRSKFQLVDSARNSEGSYNLGENDDDDFEVS